MIKENFIHAVAQSNHLSKEDTVILKYGLKKIVMLIGDALFTMLVGWILGITALSIIFQTSFLFLRLYGGGYHSETELKCKIHSAIVTVVSLIGIRIMIDHLWWSNLLFILVSVVVMILAPVEAKNKPLSAKERTINRRKTICVVILLDIIAVISRIAGGSFFYAIAVAVYAVCLLMLMGMFSERHRSC